MPSMSKEKFIKELRDSRLSKKFYFTMVGQTDTECSVTMVRKNTNRVEIAFTYENTGLIYHMIFADISFYDLKDFIDIVDRLLQ